MIMVVTLMQGYMDRMEMVDNEVTLKAYLKVNYQERGEECFEEYISTKDSSSWYVYNNDEDFEFYIFDKTNSMIKIEDLFDEIL